MTKEEAIKILKGAIKKPNTKDGYLGQALDMAIKALEQQLIPDTRQRERQLEMEYQNGYDRGWEAGRKALEQQPCEDCVSRKDAVRIASINSISVDEFVKMIKELPSVTPTITDVENNYNIGYNCGYADAMIDIAESEE